MEPVEFKGCNTKFAEKQPQYQTLPAMYLKDDTGTVITCWELSDEELMDINKTKRLFISQFTFSQPLQPILPTTKLEDVVELPTPKEFFMLRAREFAKSLKEGPSVLRFAEIGDKELTLMAAFALEMAKPDNLDRPPFKDEPLQGLKDMLENGE